MGYNPPFPTIEQNFDVCWTIVSNTWDGNVWTGHRTQIWAESEAEAVVLFKSQNPAHTYRSISRT